mmetsp:Transcript_40963/g.95682  ORF Transcript_40963/g.95682 Transcript_40963/m.95682 type:complete len:109 (+) Transcript_40963:441-767(+)
MTYLNILELAVLYEYLNQSNPGEHCKATLFTTREVLLDRLVTLLTKNLGQVERQECRMQLWECMCESVSESNDIQASFLQCHGQMHVVFLDNEMSKESKSQRPFCMWA